MVTDEHFEMLQKLRVEARNLQRACVEIAGTSALLHMSYDPEISLRPTGAEKTSMQKLRLVR